MKKLFTRISLLVTVLAMFAAPLPALAWNPFGGADCTGDAANSAVCSDQAKNQNANPLYGPNSTIVKVTDFVGLIAGIAAVIMILIGAIKYVLAGGDSKAVASAKSTIIYALIGLAVIVSATALITFIVSKL